MRKWVLISCGGLLVIAWVLASILGIMPRFNANASTIDHLSLGIAGAGRVISVALIIVLMLLAICVVIAAIYDFFKPN